MLNHCSLWSISAAKEQEREDLVKYQNRTDYSLVKYSRKDSTLTGVDENGVKHTVDVTRQKEDADQGGWCAEGCYDCYTLKGLKSDFMYHFNIG